MKVGYLSCCRLSMYSWFIGLYRGTGYTSRGKFMFFCDVIRYSRFATYFVKTRRTWLFCTSLICECAKGLRMQGVQHFRIVMTFCAIQHIRCIIYCPIIYGECTFRIDFYEKHRNHKHFLIADIKHWYMSNSWERTSARLTLTNRRSFHATLMSGVESSLKNVMRFAGLDWTTINYG